MSLTAISYTGPSLPRETDLSILPEPYRHTLRSVANGFIAFGGGLHVRGICNKPAWHSLENAMEGTHALHRLYPAVKATDLPFGQNCVGDQFLLRDGIVHRLEAETGEIESLALDYAAFIRQAMNDPEETLGLALLLAYAEEHGELKPGELLSVWPPYCTKEAAQGVSLRAIPAQERLLFLADFARQISDVADGAK